MKSVDQLLLEQAYTKVRMFTEGVYDPHIFKAIFTVGPMAAGKSTVSQKLFGGTGLRSLNLDNFNEMMIRRGEVPGGELSDEQLQKSWEKVQKQKVNFLNGRLGVHVDGSGRNAEDVKENLSTLINLGYDTLCIFVNVDLEKSIENAKKRELEQIEKYGIGRTVPLERLKKTHAEVQPNIGAFQQAFGENFFYIDTTHFPPEFFQKKNFPPPAELIPIQKKINQFLSAPPSHPAALNWIEEQKAQRNKLN